MKRLTVVALMALSVLVLGATVAFAHPLGNISVNHHLGVVVSEVGVQVTHLVDLAEIPAVQALRQVDADDDGTAAPDELAVWAGPECDRRLATVSVTMSGTPLTLTGASGSAELRPGQAGLDTLRITCTAAADLPVAAGSDLGVIQADDPGRVGWNEVVVSGDGVVVDSDAPSVSPSRALTAYPEGTASDVRSASISVVSTAGAAAAGGGLPAAAPAAPAPVRALGDLVSAADAPWAVATAIGAAFLLGVGHALAPGHGKTLMAALLVGRSGTMRNAAGLGLSVAVSHTLGVAVLGVLTLVASSTFEPALVYPWLSVVAGAIVLGLGVSVLARGVVRVWRRRTGHGGAPADHGHEHVHHDHDHPHPDDHPHHDHGPHDAHGHEDAPGHEHDYGSHNAHGHGHDHKSGVTGWWRHRHLDIDPQGGWKAFAALGLSGGLVPSASAVVLLLGAVHLGRVGLGVVLVAAFGLGMAAALTGVGALVVVFGSRVLDLLTARAAPGLVAAVPVLAGVVVLGVGATMTWSAIAGLG